MARFAKKSPLALMSVLVLAVGFVDAPRTFAQTPGLPPFSTLDHGLYDTVKVNDGGILLSLPVRSKTAVIPSNYSLIANINVTADSVNRAWINPVFTAQTSAGLSPTNFVGVLSANQTLCPDGKTRTIQYSGYYFMDGFGTEHVYKFLTTDTQACLLDDFLYDIEQGGYSLSINQDGSNPVVTDISGNQFVGYTMTDPNGNKLSLSGGIYTDPTLLTPMTETVSYSNGFVTKDVHAWTDAAGNPQKFTITYSQYTQKTNFGCSTLVDVGPTTVAYPSSIATPEGNYTITYEPTGSAYPGDVTGRIAKVVFPSGASLQYSYTGSNNGINCTELLVPVLTRTLTDAKGNVSVWKYDTTAVAYATVVTDPSGNDTVHTFSPGCCSNRTNYETLTQVYQGSHTGTGLLRTNTICYNGNFSNCATASVGPHPITQKDIYTALPGKSPQSLSETTYDELGQLTEDKEYDFGSVLVSDHVITRGTCSAVSNRVCTDALKNGSGTVVAQTNNTYDSFSNLLSSSRLTAGSTYLTKSFTYNSNGTVNVATDVNGAQTTYGNYACNGNFPTTVSEPLSLSKSMTWDCNGGVPTSLTDENSAVTTTNYKNGTTADPFYRPLSVVDPLGNTTTFGYAVTSAESAMNFNASVSTTDVLATTDGLGRNIFGQKRQGQGSSYFDSTQTTYGWNSTGALTTQSVPYSGTAAQPAPTGTAVTTTQHDALGRPLTVTDGGGGTTSYTYSQNDVLVSTGPTQNFKKQFEYDGLGRLTSVCEITSASGSGSCGQSTAATGFLTKYTYDALGNLLTVNQNAQPGAIGGTQTRGYTYDASSRLLSESNPETSNTGANGTISYAYDTDSTCGTTSNGDLVKKVDAAGNVICYARDALHRVTSVTYPSGPYSASTPSKTFVYDATTFSCTHTNVKGRLAEAFTGPSNNKTTDIAYCYSPRGETTDAFESTPNSGSTPYHTVASYWANGALNTLSGVPSRHAWTFGVDGEGRPNTAIDGTTTNLVTATTYYPTNPTTTVTLGSGDSDVYTYDQNTGRMATYQFNIGSPAQVVKGTLGWNSNGTLGSLLIADPFTTANAQNCGYSYDDLARLASVNCGPKNQDGTTWGQTFSYDAFGNIKKSGSITFAASYLLANGTTNNREQTVSSCAPTYDANGNLTTDCTFIPSYTYAWDADGNTIGINLGSSAPVAITYDAFDRIVEENKSGTYTQVLYSPIGKLALMAKQVNNNVFLPLPGGEQATYTGSTIRFRHSDWLGSARFESSTGRQEYGDVAYAPFGEPYSIGKTPYLSFTGQNQDTISGTYDFLFREYNPVQGRWISPDPSGMSAVNPANPQSWNRYTYVANAPLSATDPLGLDSDGCFGGDSGSNRSMECILPDGGSPPTLAGDPTLPSPTFPLVTTIVNVIGTGVGDVPSYLWWPYPSIFTPHPPSPAANNSTPKPAQKKTKAECERLKAEMDSINPLHTFGTDLFWSGVGAFGAGCVGGAIVGGTGGSVVGPGGTAGGAGAGCATGGLAVLGEAAEAIILGSGAHAAYEYGEKGALEKEYYDGGCHL